MILFLFAMNSLRTEIHANKDLRKKYDNLINTIATREKVEARLIHSIIKIESNYNSRAVSPKGAVGLMQLMPATAKAYQVKNLYDPRENIVGGIKYLKDLIKAYDGDTNLVLAAYNAGQEAIEKYGGVPPYPETINYIKRVTSGYKKSTKRHRTKIYKFYNKSGRLVFTDDKNYYLLNSKHQTPNPK